MIIYRIETFILESSNEKLSVVESKSKKTVVSYGFYFHLLCKINNSEYTSILSCDQQRMKIAVFC